MNTVERSRWVTQMVAAAAMAVSLSGAANALGGDDPLDGLDVEQMLKRSVVSAGDVTRLQRAMAKARAGKPVTVAAIGGSITQGALAGRPALRNYTAPGARADGIVMKREGEESNI
jgi:hypothetical protein